MILPITGVGHMINNTQNVIGTLIQERAQSHADRVFLFFEDQKIVRISRSSCVICISMTRSLLIKLLKSTRRSTRRKIKDKVR
jgi:hypothetical protein